MDGKPKTFHLKCDNQGPTLTVLKTTEGYIFGGYIDKSFTSGSQYLKSKKAFIFTLNCHAKLKPMKFDILPDHVDYAAYDGPSWGPEFGVGCDIFICDKSNLIPVTINGKSYNYPCNVDKNVCLVGAFDYIVRDYEVFKCEYEPSSSTTISRLKTL